MYSDNKQIRDVADVAARIMSGQQPVTEKLHPNQQKIDVHEPEKDEITADDFKKLRAKKEVKKEEVEQIDELSKETLGSYLDKKKSEYMKGKTQSGSKENAKDIQNMGKAHDKMKKEEVESIDEVKMADLPSTKVQGRAYGASKPEPHRLDVMKGPTEKQLLGIQAEKKKKKFSEMVNLYQEKGLKSLSEMLVKEEPDNEQFTKELEDAKAKSEGKKRNTEIAKGAVQAVKQEGIEITDEMIFEVLENAGIDFESLDDDELQIVANEAYEILDELSTQTMSSYVKKVGHEGEFTKKRVSGLNKALTKIKQNDLKKEEVKINESVKIVDRDYDLDQEHFKLHVNGKPEHFVHHNYENGHVTDSKEDIHYQVKKQLPHLAPKHQKAVTDTVHASYRMKEEVELDEREMTDAEMKKREDIVKGMKKGMAGFKERYGDRAKNVMYATANKQAMKD